MIACWVSMLSLLCIPHSRQRRCRDRGRRRSPHPGSLTEPYRRGDEAAGVRPSPARTVTESDLTGPITCASIALSSAAGSWLRGGDRANRSSSGSDDRVACRAWKRCQSGWAGVSFFVMATVGVSDVGSSGAGILTSVGIAVSMVRDGA